MAKRNRLPQPESEKRALIYCRVSTKGQEEEGTSLETQENFCRQYAAEHGYTVKGEHVYREVFTGSELWERPQLTMLREAVRHHEADVIIAYAIDRLSRDQVHLGVIITEAAHVGVDVLFVTESLDDTPEGRLLRSVQGYVAEVERLKIRERTIRGKLAKANSGKMLGTGGVVKFGYQWRYEQVGPRLKRVGLDENPETAPIVRRIFAEALAGVPLRQIAAKLDAEGIPRMTEQALRWYYCNLHRLLSDPIYTGKAVALRWITEKEKNGRRTWKKRAEENQIPLPEGTAPALVDMSTFEEVQKRLRLNRERSARNNKHPELALLRGGIVRCGYCDHALVADGAQKGIREEVRYSCKNQSASSLEGHQSPSIMAAVLDDAVWRQIVAVLTNPEIIKTELDRMEQEDTSKVDAEAVALRLAEIDRRRKNVASQIAMLDPDSAAFLREQLEALTKQHKALSKELETLEAQQAQRISGRVRFEEFAARCRSVAERVDVMTYDEKRLALEALGVSVKLWAASHTPRYEIIASIPMDAIIEFPVLEDWKRSNVLRVRWAGSELVAAG